MRYVSAKLREHQEGMAYRFYISDALMMTSKTLAKQYGGSYPDKRFADIYTMKPADSRDASEIINDVLTRAGIKVVQ